MKVLLPAAALVATVLAMPTQMDQTTIGQNVYADEAVTRAASEINGHREQLVVKQPPTEAFFSRPVNEIPLEILAEIEATTIKRPTKEKVRPALCFCAGGSTCCHVKNGIDCNYGVCGI